MIYVRGFYFFRIILSHYYANTAHISRYPSITVKIAPLED